MGMGQPLPIPYAEILRAADIAHGRNLGTSGQVVTEASYREIQFLVDALRVLRPYLREDKGNE